MAKLDLSVGGGLEQGRMAYGAAYLDSPDAPPPLKEKLPADGDGGGSFNHGGLLSMNGYVSGSPRGREMLKEGLEIQRREGHCCRGPQIETFSPSHSQLNQAWAGVSLFHAVRHKDGPMIEMLRDWWWAEMALCQEHVVPGRESKSFDNRQAKKGEREPDLWGGGWRALQDGHLIGGNACRDLCWRLVFGHPVPKRGHRLWKDKYYLAARALNILPPAELKALRPAPGFIPPLRYPFHSRRTEGSYVAWWDVPEGNPDVARSGGLGPGGLWVSTDKMVDEPQGAGVDWPAVAAVASRAARAASSPSISSSPSTAHVSQRHHHNPERPIPLVPDKEEGD